MILTQQKTLQNTNQQSYINLIQVNDQQQQQQQVLPSISSLINFNNSTTNCQNDFLVNNSNCENNKLPSIETISNKFKHKSETLQEISNLAENTLINYNNNNNNNEMDWNDAEFLSIFEQSSTNTASQDEPTLINEFLTTTTETAGGEVGSNQQQNNFIFDNDGFFTNKNITMNDENSQHQQQSQQFLNNTTENQFCLENIFTDNEFLSSLQDNTSAHLTNEINNRSNANGATFYVDPVTFDLIDNDFNQYSYLESPIV